MKKEEYIDIINKFSKLNALVVGDVMLDAYVWGKVERLSPEAPVPVVAVSKRESRLGGAANVALNFKSLGAGVILCSVTGNDERGKELHKLLRKENISTDHVIFDNERITTTKFRIIGNNTQLLRVDEETEAPLSPATSRLLIEKVANILAGGKVDVLLFQDYDKGLLNEENIRGILRLAAKYNVPVAVDPKKKNFFAYQGVSLFKPNLKELSDSLNVSIDKENKEELRRYAQQLKNRLQPEMLLLTLSEKGIYLNYPGGELFAPAMVRQVADVSGAGDTLISVAALCLALKVEPERMAKIANIAGGLVCEEIGVVPITKGKMENRINQLMIEE